MSPSETPKPERSATPQTHSRRSRLKAWARDLGLLAFVFFAISAWQSRNTVDSGQAAPDFRLSSVDGKQVQLSDFRGPRVLLHFWATWCGVCRAELGSLNALHDGRGSDEKLLTILSPDCSLADARAFVQEHGIRYTVLLSDPSTTQAYRLRSYPTNYYVDALGQIDAATVGMSNRIAMGTRLRLAR